MTLLRPTRATSRCPCSSGALYRDCCAPFHAANREPETPEELMRSRYSAFAVGAIEHLMRTLHPDHPDCELPVEALRGSLEKSCKSFRYTGLTIEAASQAGDAGTVTFVAKVFDRGTDRSFRERSIFHRIPAGWRYLEGTPLPLS